MRYASNALHFSDASMKEGSGLLILCGGPVCWFFTIFYYSLCGFSIPWRVMLCGVGIHGGLGKPPEMQHSQAAIEAAFLHCAAGGRSVWLSSANILHFPRKRLRLAVSLCCSSTMLLHSNAVGNYAVYSADSQPCSTPSGMARVNPTSPRRRVECLVRVGCGPLKGCCG